MLNLNIPSYHHSPKISLILRQNEATVLQGSRIVAERLSMAYDINFSHLKGSGTAGLCDLHEQALPRIQYSTFWAYPKLH